MGAFVLAVVCCRAPDETVRVRKGSHKVHMPLEPSTPQALCVSLRLVSNHEAVLNLPHVESEIPTEILLTGFVARSDPRERNRSINHRQRSSPKQQSFMKYSFGADVLNAELRKCTSVRNSLGITQS